ncbi:MAG: efflux RND transporter permease subunit [Planctomycetes bacterium]|nr:efflux RND transporter permease subunit [Planctomycetota bacterium]
MLNALVRLALARRGVVIALAAFLVVWGVWTAMHARLDVLPDFAPPQVVVQTECPGLSAEQVELLVTRPVEASMAGSAHLEALRSQSIQGLSIVTATFKDGTDPHLARQLLAQQISEAESRLPAGVAPPRMTPLTSATMDVLKIGLVSDRMEPRALRAWAQWTLRPRLLSVPGVATASLFGGEVERLEVQVLPERLAAFDLTLAEVADAARQATGVRGAGFVDTPNQRLVVETRGQFGTPEELANVVLRVRDGVTLRLGDVARVVVSGAPKFGDALVQGRPGVLVTLLSQYGAYTLDVTLGLEAALAELQPVFDAQGITVHPRMHRPATFIEHALGNLETALLLGAALVDLVLLLFLFDLRTAFISLTAIPLSLFAALVVLHESGATLNTITLGGLAIALGEVVDDAIIDVENILRRLRENARLPSPRSAAAVVLDASIEVRGAVVYATFVVVLVFVPVLSMSGLQGRLFAPLGSAYILAVLASLLVALTLTPALALLLLPGRAARAEEPRHLRALRRGYERVVGVSVRHVALASGFALALVAAAAWIAPGLGFEFLPEFREGHFVLQVSAAPGTSLEEMKRIGGRISAELLADPRIATVEQQIGRAELGEDPWGTNRSEFHVEIRPMPADEESATQEWIRAVLTGFPGLTTEVLTFLGDRISETITGETADVVVNVFGEDLDLLDAAAADVARELSTVHGAVDVRPGASAGTPSIAVDLDSAALARAGLRPGAVLDEVEIACQGVTVAEVWEEGRVRDVAVTLAPEARARPEDVARIELRGASGALWPLASLAHVYQDSGRALLSHESGRRRQVVTCNVEDRDVGGFVAEARTRIGGVKLPAGVDLAYAGAAEQSRVARNELLLRSTFALGGIVLLLALVFRSARNLLVVLANLPFALVGGLFVLQATSGVVSMGALVGFVTLFGITLRNSIMLVSHYEHLVVVEREPWGLATAVRGASERLVPILMTASVTALGLLPLALGSGAGREIEGPMALVILGGLASSTLLNLLVLPALALRFGRFERARTGS